MRIATSTMNSMATGGINNAYQNYMDIMNKIASNKNFTKISENVVDGTKVVKLNNQLSDLNDYQSNIQAAMDEMDLAYDTLGAIQEELTTIQGLVVQAANVTTSESSAQAIDTELKERVNIIIDKMNTQYLDNYIFSGTYIQETTITKNDDGTVTYNGNGPDDGKRNLTIAENTTFSYNLSGNEIFKATDGSDDDFFAQMTELSKKLNESPLDYNAIREKLSIIDSTRDNVLQMQGKVSAYATKLATTKSINDETIINLTENKIGLEEVDITKAASDLASAQTSLQASYLVGTTVLNSVSLLDFL